MVRRAALLLALATFVPFVASAASAEADVPSVGKARHNIAPTPSFLAACVTRGAMSRQCISQSVAAINNARRYEPMQKYRFVLPRDYSSLTPAEQAFVVINLERVDRGLRPIAGMVPLLNTVAKVAAVAEIDPDPATLLLQGLGVRRYQTIWARDYGVLAADYEWMYDDGYSRGSGSTNVVCPYVGAAGCWSHRIGILTPFTGLPSLLVGIGAAAGIAHTVSVSAVLTGGYGGLPRLTYSWRQALAHGANGHR